MVKMAGAAAKFVSDGKGGVKKSDATAGAKPPKTEAAKPREEKKDPPKARAAAANANEGDKKLTYEARMRQLVPVERVRRKLAATIIRFRNLTDEIGTWKNANDLNSEAKNVLEALETMTDVAKAMPDDFKPEKDRKARESHLKPGAVVHVRAKFAEGYVGILGKDEEEVAELELTVIDIVKGRVACKSSDGKVFIPRAHLAVEDTDDEEEDEDSEEDEA